MFFLFFSFQKKKKKKTAAFELSGSKKDWADRSQAMHLIDIGSRAQSWSIFVTKDFGLAKLSRLF